MRSRGGAICSSSTCTGGLAALSRTGALAAARDHPFTTAWALAFEFMVHMFRQEPKTLAAADRTLAFCSAQGTPFWIASGIIVCGWARARPGESDAGIDEMRQGMQLYEAIGSRIVQPLWFGLLAEALLSAERHAEARAALATGFTIATANEERLSEIELWRIQGDLDCSAYQGDRERACRSYASVGDGRAFTRHSKSAAHQPAPMRALRVRRPDEINGLRGYLGVRATLR